MAFNIKNEETIELARQLAARRGESIARVFDTAIREHAERMGDVVEARVGRIHTLVQDINERITPLSTRELDELLYDPETGLPR